MPLLHFGGMIMATIPIYFSDLKEDAQKRLLEAQASCTGYRGPIPFNRQCSARVEEYARGVL